MRHIFILNPAAGKHQDALALRPQIEAFFRDHPMDYTVYETSAPNEATAITRRECQKGDAVRFYACGGDGTLSEVAIGMADAPHAELACVPCGSANDLLRFMPNKERFWDITAQILGTARKVDAISCNGMLSMNICSLGVDADVAARMVRYKHLPLVSGPMAYNLALVDTFLRPLGQRLRIVMQTENGTVEREGDYMFALAANGQYYGGGYHGSPRSQIDDGLLDFILVEKVSHLKMLTILGKYKRGEHLDLACCESFRGTAMDVYADTPAVTTVDGECFEDTHVRFEILPASISFVFPCENTDEMLKKCKNTAICQDTP